MADSAATCDRFWDFSLAFYALPGIAPAFLQLQDESGADVNVLLFLLFLARAGRQLSDADVMDIDALAAPWRSSVIVPLREVRRRLKAPLGVFDTAASASLRTEVQRTELAAEQLQQQTLERHFPAVVIGVPLTDRLVCARTNLFAYGRRIGGLHEQALGQILERFAQLQ
jgi:uncharacterized protein (TIGR02444 family)